MTHTNFRRIRREAYLNRCLREIAQSYQEGGFASREEYLQARREERERHRQEWQEEDENN